MRVDVGESDGKRARTHSLTHSLTHTFTHPLTSPSLQEDEDSDDAEAKETAAAMKVSHAFI